MKGLFLVLAAIVAAILWRARQQAQVNAAAAATNNPSISTINVPSETQFVQTTFPPAAAPPPWTPTPIIRALTPPLVGNPTNVVVNAPSPISSVAPVPMGVYPMISFPSPAPMTSVGSPAALTVPLAAPAPVTAVGGSGQSTTPPPTPAPTPLTVPTVTIGGIIRPITYGGGIVRTITL